MSHFIELFIAYVLLPLFAFFRVVAAPLIRVVGWVIGRIGQFINWLAGIAPNLGIGLVYLVLLVIIIGELVFEGWLLRRIAQNRNPWVRRPLILATVFVFYLIACAQMAGVSLALGVGVDWYIWIVVTTLHLMGWALNTVLRRPFVYVWRGMSRFLNWIFGPVTRWSESRRLYLVSATLSDLNLWDSPKAGRKSIGLFDPNRHYRVRYLGQKEDRYTHMYVIEMGRSGWVNAQLLAEVVDEEEQLVGAEA